MRHLLAVLLIPLLLAAPVSAEERPAEGEAALPGYMVVIGNGVDPAGMRDYARAAVPLLFQYGGKLLFTTEEGQTEVLEGGPFPGSIRVFRFPSIQAARDYYYSDAYQAAIPLRAGNGKIDVMLGEGFIPDPKWGPPPAAE